MTCLAFTLLLCACSADATDPTNLAAPGGEEPTTTSFTEAVDTDTSIIYDFNGDGSVDVLIVSPNPDRETGGFGLARDLVVSSTVNGDKTEWYRSESAILPSSQVGKMEDPFQRIHFEKDRQTLWIEHSGGGAKDRWRYRHGFRFRRGGFELVSAIVEYGTPCARFERLEYMPSTGEAFYELAAQKCEADREPAETVLRSEAFLQESTPLPSLHNFRPGENSIAVPGKNRAMFY